MITGNAAAVLAIALGGLICFFGYRLLRVTLGVAGFLLGAGLGWFFASAISGIAPLVVIIIALAAGALGAVLAALIYKLGVFLLGAGAGALIAASFLAGRTGTVGTLVIIAVAVLTGVVTVLLQRAMVTVLTALAGAWGVALGAFHLVGWLDMHAGRTLPEALQPTPGRALIMLACWLGLALVGLVLQLASHRKR